jgi:hypothetical protein
MKRKYKSLLRSTASPACQCSLSEAETRPGMRLVLRSTQRPVPETLLERSMVGTLQAAATYSAGKTMV